MKHLKSIMAGIIAVFLWAAIPTLVKIGSKGQDLSYLIFIRFLISSAVFTPMGYKIILKAKSLSIKYWLSLIAVLISNYYFQGLAMSLLPASWYIVIFSLNPILALFASGLRIEKKLFVVMILPIVGTFLFIGSDGWGHSGLALLYLTIGMLTWVTYTVLLKPLQEKLNDIETTGFTQFMALLGSGTLWITMGMPHQALDSPEISSILILGLSTPLAYYTFSYCMRRLPVFGILS